MGTARLLPFRLEVGTARRGNANETVNVDLVAVRFRD